MFMIVLKKGHTGRHGFDCAPFTLETPNTIPKSRLRRRGARWCHQANDRPSGGDRAGGHFNSPGLSRRALEVSEWLDVGPPDSEPQLERSGDKCVSGGHRRRFWQHQNRS